MLIFLLFVIITKYNLTKFEQQCKMAH